MNASTMRHDSWIEQKKRWASIRAAFADHVYEASEPEDKHGLTNSQIRYYYRDLTDEQAIALLQMGLSDQPEIFTSINGIFAGTVIGVKTSAIKNGIMHVAFGPDEQTASNRLREKLK